MKMKLLYLQIVNRILVNQKVIMEALKNLMPNHASCSYLSESINHTNKIIDIVRSDESEQQENEF